MKTKYRIIKRTYPTAKEDFVAQYKFIFWISITNAIKGTFFGDASCESIWIALYRIHTHQDGMKRTSEWAYKTKEIVWTKK